MTPTLHPLVVRFKNRKAAAKAGFKKDYYIAITIDGALGLYVISDKKKISYFFWKEVEIINHEDFSFNESDL